MDTLDALDELKELSSAEELKNKLLFSVVVVSCLGRLSLDLRFGLLGLLFIFLKEEKSS